MYTPCDCEVKFKNVVLGSAYRCLLLDVIVRRTESMWHHKAKGWPDAMPGFYLGIFPVDLQRDVHAGHEGLHDKQNHYAWMIISLLTQHQHLTHFFRKLCKYDCRRVPAR